MEKKMLTDNIKMEKIKQDYLNLYPNRRIKFDGEFTKAFKQFNKEQFINQRTDVLYDKNLIYNRDSGRFLKKDRYLTKKGTIREKFKDDIYQPDNKKVIGFHSNYIKGLLPQIKTIEQKSQGGSLTINKQALGNLKNLLPKLKPTTKRYRLFAGGKYYYLNSKTLSQLQEILNKTQEVEYEEIDIDSARSIMVGIITTNNFQLEILPASKNPLPDSGFFPFINKIEKVDLSRYGVFTEIKSENYELNCLCLTLQTAGYDISEIKQFVKNQEIPFRLLGKVAEKMKIYITIKRLDQPKNKSKYGDPTHPLVEIGVIERHYFLIEKTNYTSYSIENYFDISEQEDFNKIITFRREKYEKSNKRFIDSFALIKLLVDNKKTHLQPIDNHTELYKTPFFNRTNKTFNNLNYDIGTSTKAYISKPKREKTILETIYFDFETTTKTNNIKYDRHNTENGYIPTNHKPYCMFTDKSDVGYFGENCGKQFLIGLCQKYGVAKNNEVFGDVWFGKRTIRLIAHNAGYDFRFLLEYLDEIFTIEKGTGLMSATAVFWHNNKVIHLTIRDSLKMINMPLREFSSAFQLEAQKEILPYDLYTEESIKVQYLDVDYCLKFVSDKDKKEYLENCEKWDCIHNNKIDILKYSGKYCYMDCITLKQGYEKFTELVSTGIKVDVNEYISLASMSMDYLAIAGCYDECYSLSGIPRDFIQQCLVGGRTMCANNKKQIYRNTKIADYDAVSLYPSAMSRMDGFLKGIPKVIQNFEPEKYDGYFIKIKIDKIGIKRDFPLLSYMNDKGVRIFSNDMVGREVYIDKVSLEDAVKYQKVEYTFIQGYYFDDGFNKQINDSMKHLFNQRLKYKNIVYVFEDKDIKQTKCIAEYSDMKMYDKSKHKDYKNIIKSNPLQLIFKELMNSSYGKNCLKPIETNDKYIKDCDMDKFIDRNFNYLKESVLLPNGKYHKVKVNESIDKHFNYVHIGVEILSWSKRIMNEVMCLGEDLGLKMFYQDTDSIHLFADDIPKLEEAFKKEYNRELKGKNMGQFHIDFVLKGACGDIVATDSIFLGKKCYIDKLKSIDKNGNDIFGYHIRMKGVGDEVVEIKAEQEYCGDIMKLYEDLFEGKKISFNLLANRPKFEMRRDMSVWSKSTFDREISF